MPPVGNVTHRNHPAGVLARSTPGMPTPDRCAFALLGNKMPPKYFDSLVLQHLSALPASAYALRILFPYEVRCPMRTSGSSIYLHDNRAIKYVSAAQKIVNARLPKLVT
jgi:hypothetical protein